jgi:N-acetylhexosamine 1-kinase
VKEQACKLTQLQLDGVLPLRVTHNDTKINNVLFDKETDDALVVIDLDTVMPGLVGHDFGDAVRFAANLVEEDCPEPEKAGVNMDVFRAFAEGFLSKTAKSLTQPEIDTLALSCLALTCELATRFLADYIAGDVYFKTNYPEHNLVRTRCQIALAKDMLQKLPEMEKIIRDCVENLQ